MWSVPCGTARRQSSLSGNSPPDLVTLDLNMPGRGGLETLSDIQDFNASRPDRPPVGVLLVSALTERGAAVTVEGLRAGGLRLHQASRTGPTKRPMRPCCDNSCSRRSISSRSGDGRLSSTAIQRPEPAAPPPIQRTGRFQAVAIGSSTGGPEALVRVLPVLTRQASVPMFIVQHFPQGMTRYFADSLGRKCDYRVVEASDGEAVQPRTAYIAPGGRHMIVRKHDGRVLIALTISPRRMDAGLRWMFFFVRWPPSTRSRWSPSS